MHSTSRMHSGLLLIATFALVGCEDAVAPPREVTLKIEATNIINVAMLHESLLTVDGQGYCHAPRVRLGDIEVSPVFASVGYVLVPGTPVLSGALDKLKPDWKTGCDWSFPTTVSVDCSEASPRRDLYGNAVYVTPAASLSFDLEKHPVAASVLPATTTNVPPSTSFAYRFSANGFDESTVANSIRVDGVAGKVVTGVIEGEGAVISVPDEVLAFDTSYTATFTGGDDGARNTMGGCAMFDKQSSTTMTFHTRGSEAPPFQLRGRAAAGAYKFEWDEIPGAAYEFFIKGSEDPIVLTTNTFKWWSGGDCAQVTAIIGEHRIVSNELCTADVEGE